MNVITAANQCELERTNNNFHENVLHVYFARAHHNDDGINALDDILTRTYNGHRTHRTLSHTTGIRYSTINEHNGP